MDLPTTQSKQCHLAFANHKVRHDDWRGQFEQLAVFAVANVIMPTPGRDMGPNFRSELEFIKTRGLDARTVVVGPPGLDDGTISCVESSEAPPTMTAVT